MTATDLIECSGHVATLPVDPKELAFRAIDDLEVKMMECPPADCPVTHSFVPGFYVRQIFMPAGSTITSKIHKTRHPYHVSRGRVSVWIQDTGWVEIIAPYTGITEAGTRRILLVHEDTMWTTFHPTELTDVAQIEEQIIEKRDEHRLGMVQPYALEGGF